MYCKMSKRQSHIVILYTCMASLDYLLHTHETDERGSLLNSPDGGLLEIVDCGSKK